MASFKEGSNWKIRLKKNSSGGFLKKRETRRTAAKSGGANCDRVIRVSLEKLDD